MRGEAGLPRRVTPEEGPGARVRTHKTGTKANTGMTSRMGMQRRRAAARIPHSVARGHAAAAAAAPLVFGLWRMYFPPVLVRTGRRLPVQALGERGVLVASTSYPRNGAPGPVEALSPGLPEIKERSGI